MHKILIAAAITLGLPMTVMAQKSVEDFVREAQQNRTKYIESMAQGIVRVEAYASEARKDPELGTGVVLSASPEKVWILTALHVVREARSVDVMFYSDRPTRYRASVQPRCSDSLDLAVLLVSPQGNPKLPSVFPEYHFLQSGELQLAEQIYSVNGDWNIVPNAISRLSHGGDVQRFEYTNVSVGNGFSGGPVFDQYGNVIGMHDARTGEGANYALAVKIDVALETLQALEYAVPKPGTLRIAQMDAMPKPQAGAPPPTTSRPAFSVEDMTLYQTAIFSRDPAAMEAAAAKISNPTYANSLRTQAQMLRNSTQAIGSARVPDSRKRLQTASMRTEAKSYAGRGNYAKALPLYQQLAEGGDSESMVNLGYMYYNGWGTAKDYAQAAKWFEKAAAEGETKVMATLGMMYAMGMGVQRNDGVALEWDKKAAAVGDALGMLGLGYMYENGRGVPKDLKAAAEWYRKSADSGNETAKENLRRMGVRQ